MGMKLGLSKKKMQTHFEESMLKRIFGAGTPMESEENTTTGSVISGFILHGILLGSVVQHR